MENDMKNEPDCSSSSSSTPISQKRNQTQTLPKMRVQPKPKESVVKRKDMNSNNSREDYYLNEKLSTIKVPTTDLPLLDKTEKKFCSKSRLYIGNLPPKIIEEKVTDLFKKYGEVNDAFINDSKNFAFLKMDYYINALKAKNELNGYIFNGKSLIVRFAQPPSVLVKNLPLNITDELLHLGFSVFGEIEHCSIVVDAFGKPTGKGIIIFAKKGSAILAKKRCAENSFFLTSSLKPIILEDYEPFNDVDGFSERQIRKTEEYYRSRELPPRFAKPGTFEYDYGKRWKELHRKYKEKKDALKKELHFEEQQLETEMVRAQYDHETERLKELLRRREMERDRLNQQWNINRPHSSMQANVECNDDNRVRQESLYTQATQLTHMLESQEQELQEWNVMSYSTGNSGPERFEPWDNQPSPQNYTRPKRPRL